MVATAWAACDFWKQRKIEKRYVRAVQLHQSMDSTERRLSLVLLSQIPVTDDVVRLIGVGLFDAELENRLYAAGCLKAIFGARVPLPNDAQLQVSQAVARPTIDSEEHLQIKFTSESLPKYISLWQVWFRNNYPV